MTLEQIGPYKVLRKLGEGGMGAVFEALHETIEKRVAIKILHPEYARTSEFAARFFNEARAVNKIDHPGLVQVNDYGQLPDGTAYIVMEYLKGETLGFRLKRTSGNVPLGESLRLLRQIASALSAAHKKGIVHRDLKPDNIMLVPDPETMDGERAKLLDFGIAKLVEDVPDEKQVRTKTNQLIGTPRYMSPEQCRGAGGVDDRTDVYSLGVILYQLLARRPPFVGAGSGELMAMHIYEAPPPLDKVLPDTPAPLVQLTYRMLAKAKAERPSMQEVVAALEGFSAAPARSGELSGARDSGALPLSISISTDESIAPTVDAPSAPSIGAATGQREKAPTVPSMSTSLVKDRGQPLLFVGLGGALVAAGIGGFLYLRTPGAAKTTPPPSSFSGGTTTDVKPPPRTTVRWSIDSEPTGADVVRVSDGQLLGKTPWSREQPPSGGAILVRLRYPGFAERQLSLDQMTDITRRETLDAVPGAPRPVATPPGPAAKSANSTPRPSLKKKTPPAKGPKPSNEKIEIE
jgi:serine/threonine protein kinase